MNEESNNIDNMSSQIGPRWGQLLGSWSLVALELVGSRENY
jgi:hypothetical protein